MTALLYAPYYILGFLLVMTVVVAIHEYGHFWVARRCGVRVEVFSIGFGPELWGRVDRHGTRWRVGLLPFGGYVRMFGEGLAGGDAAREAEASGDIRASFAHKKLWQRAAIVAAGPAANYLLALILFIFLFMSVGERVTAPVIGEVLPNSAAAVAGLLPGDRIRSVNDVPTDSFESVAEAVQFNLDQPLSLEVERGGNVLAIAARPAIEEITDTFGNRHRVGRLGIAPAGDAEWIQHSPGDAIITAFAETYHLTARSLEFLYQMITGVRPVDELGGVVRIAKMSGDVAQLGLTSILAFIAFLSVSLGLFNLFPIPVLDGGHLAFYAIEAVFGRPLARRAQEWGTFIGLALVGMLFIVALRNDLMSFPSIADYFTRG